MNILSNTLLPNDRVQALPVIVSNIIRQIPVIDKNIEVEVGPIMRILATDPNFVFRLL